MREGRNIVVREGPIDSNMLPKDRGELIINPLLESPVVVRGNFETHGDLFYAVSDDSKKVNTFLDLGQLPATGNGFFYDFLEK